MYCCNTHTLGCRVGVSMRVASRSSVLMVLGVMIEVGCVGIVPHLTSPTSQGRVGGGFYLL